MGITRGGLHDFNDKRDFEDDKLDNKLGKSAQIGRSKKNKYVPNSEEEQTAKEIRHEHFYETSKTPPKEEKKPSYWKDDIYAGAPKQKTNPHYWRDYISTTPLETKNPNKKWWQFWK